MKSEAGECSATFILFTEVGSTSVDFSHICTLLEYLFSWRLFTFTWYIWKQISVLSASYLLKSVSILEAEVGAITQGTSRIIQVLIQELGSVQSLLFCLKFGSKTRLCPVSFLLALCRLLTKEENYPICVPRTCFLLLSYHQGHCASLLLLIRKWKVHV